MEELRRRIWGRPSTPGVYAEQPATGKRSEHDPRVFLTPANPTKRQREQIPLQRKLPLRYLSSLRQTSGPGGLFSQGDMSGCDTLLHLFGCEALIKSESDARRPTATVLSILPKVHLQVGWNEKSITACWIKHKQISEKWECKQIQTNTKTGRKGRGVGDLSAKEVPRVWNFPSCCLFSLAVRWNSLSNRQSGHCPYTPRRAYCLQRNLLTLLGLLFQKHPCMQDRFCQPANGGTRTILIQTEDENCRAIPSIHIIFLIFFFFLQFYALKGHLHHTVQL